jgi:hypothetical protein
MLDAPSLFSLAALLFVIEFAIHISGLENKWEFPDKTVRCSESNSTPAKSSRLTYHTASA